MERVGLARITFAAITYARRLPLNLGAMLCNPERSIQVCVDALLPNTYIKFDLCGIHHAHAI